MTSRLPPGAVSPLHRFTASDIARARAGAAASGQPGVAVLEEQSGLDPQAFLEALASTLSYPALTLPQARSMLPAFDLLPFTDAARRHCLLLRHGEGMVLGFSDPFDADLLQWAEAKVPGAFVAHLMHRRDLTAYFAQHEDSVRGIDAQLAPPAAPDVAHARVESLSLLRISEDASPVVRLVHSTVYDALKSGASDIHLESDASGLTIRYRIDGVLNAMGSIAGTMLAEQVLSRIKVMSELDIAEQRVPQDGRFRVALNGREVDLRVSIMPSAHGEDAVLRILDRRAISAQAQGIRLTDLGFDQTTLARLRKLFGEPHGMVLVTGPTGSGKTTTLYGAVWEVNDGRDKIVTIEDPVEYQLPGVLQIPVNEKKGLTFARGLRSILRHDPDKIMVGEIRDPETAQIAVQSALTGHLVLTTVHANNVFDVIGRFTHMGVDPYSFVSSLNGILAQRLVRLVCPQCAEHAPIEEARLTAAGIRPEQMRDAVFKRGRGCGHCRGSGFRGRRAIGELLNLNDEIREMIVMREPVRHLKEAARRNGTRYLRESAVALLLAGETTLDEIDRVTFVE